jgi:hypothetical protein
VAGAGRENRHGIALADGPLGLQQRAGGLREFGDLWPVSAHQPLGMPTQARGVPGYTDRVFVTNRPEAPEVLWRDYNGRATVEQRIEELKNDLAADGFCVREFFGTEAALLAMLFAFNLLSLYQRTTSPERPYRQPATLRAQVFVAGAVLGVIGKQLALK